MTMSHGRAQRKRTIASESLTQCTYHHYTQYCEYDPSTLEKQPHIDYHTYAYKEIWYKDGIAKELQSIHQRRNGRNETIEYQSAEESAENALQSYQFTEGGTHKHHGENEDELHNRIAITAEETARQSTYGKENGQTAAYKLEQEDYPEIFRCTTI